MLTPEREAEIRGIIAEYRTPGVVTHYGFDVAIIDLLEAYDEMKQERDDAFTLLAKSVDLAERATTYAEILADPMHARQEFEDAQRRARP